MSRSFKRGARSLATSFVLVSLACSGFASADEKPPPANADTPGVGAKTPPANADTPPANADTPGASAKTPPASADTPPANADTSPANEKSAEAEQKIIEVRVIGSSADALQKVPGSGQLIGAKDVARAQAVDVSELLRRVPGLLVRQEGGGGLRLDISVRGLDSTRSRRVLVLEDGVPVGNNPYGEPDLYYSTPVERVRGIEVVKGSGSILFGPNTVGGVVQFLTYAPPDERRIHVRMDAGAPGQFELLGRYGDRWGDVRYIAQISGKRGDGARGEGYYATDAFAKVALPVSAQSEITAKVGFHDEGVTSTDLGLTQGMFEADPRRPTLAPYDFVHLRRIDGSLLHKMWLTENVELRTLLYATSTERLWRRQDYDRSAVPGISYQRIAGDITKPQGAIFFRNTNTIRDRSYAVFGVEPKLTYRFATGGVQHTLDVGGRFLSESAHRVQRAGENPLSESGSLQTDEDSSTSAISAYVQDRIAFTDYLLVTPGFRFEFASSQRNIRRAIVAGEAKDVSITGATNVYAPIPGLGLVLGTPRLHGFGGLHFGFAPPRIASAITDTGVNEQLAPERAIHYEAGLRAQPFRFLRGEATFFLSNFENQVIPALRAGGATTDLVNGGQTRHVGAEVSARMEIGRALGLPLSIDLYAGYTALSATFVGGPNNDRFLPYAPVHNVSTTLDVEHPIGLGALVAWTFVGSQFADEANTKLVDVTGRVGELPAYQLLDLSLRYTHKATGLGGVLSIKNALDEIYVTSRRPDGIFPAGFRQIIGSLRWTYDEAHE